MNPLLSLGRVRGNELLDLLDWLMDRKPWIEKTLARRYLKKGTVVLFDVSSTYFEGHKGVLSAFGYSRDHRKERPQIVIGLLCGPTGCPISVAIFSGNTADLMTLSSPMEKLKNKSPLSKVVLVGDRGMITTSRIEKELKPHG